MSAVELRARDAQDDRIVRAAHDARLGDVMDQVRATRATCIAVFSEDVFDGFVKLQDIMFSSPLRIFADQKIERLLPRVHEDLPLQEALIPLREGSLEAVPVVNDAGAFVGAITQRSALDTLMLHERSMHEESEGLRTLIEEKHQRISAIVDTAVDGIITIDEQGIVETFNHAAESLFGYDALEVIDRNVSMLMPPPYRQEHDGYLARYLRTGEAKIIGIGREAVGIRKDRTTFPLDLSVSRVQLTDRCLFTGIVRDVTERTQAERALWDAKNAAEAANRAKSEFLANMSHEIRTPMTAILGFADVLVEHGDLENAPPERIEAAKTIKRNGEHLIAIINNILDLSKIEVGKMVVDRTPCSPLQIADEVMSLQRVQAESKGLSVEIHCGTPIPETIRTDSTRLRQILLNVVGNAIKFTDHGGVRLEASLVGNGDAPLMQFDVVDTGKGMTEEEVSRVFQPFTQADTSTTREFGGTGLGLAISKRFGELLGGDVTVVESTPGVGTRVRVTVTTGPLDAVKMVEGFGAATSVTSERAKPPAAANLSSIDGYRILLAEDGPDNQRLILFVLKKAGAEVTIVENGELAVDAALTARDAGAPFDVILMDMQMPVMDGYEATRLLRRNGYDGPIIALTAHAMADDRQKCINAGCDDYATKPIDRNKLITTIQAWRRKGSLPKKEHASLATTHETTDGFVS